MSLVSLCCSMTPGSSKDIDLSYAISSHPQSTRKSRVRPHIKWVVSLVIADCHFILLQGFVWVCMV